MFNTWNMCWIKLAWWCAYQNLQMVSFLFRTSMSFMSWSGLCSIFFLYFNKVYWRTSRCKSKSHYTLKILYYLIPHFFFSIVNHVRQYYYSQEVDMFWAYIVVMSFEGPILICRALLTQDISYCMPNSIKLKKKKKKKREEHTSRRKWQFGMNVDLVHFEHFCICKYTKDIANV